MKCPASTEPDQTAQQLGHTQYSSVKVLVILRTERTRPLVEQCGQSGLKVFAMAGHCKYAFNKLKVNLQFWAH
jgi:hypothetical protein